MENTQVVDELNVAGAKLESQRVLLGRKVHRIKRLGLRLRDGRDVRTPRQAPVARERPPSILDNDALGAVLPGGLVVQERSGRISRGASLAKSAPREKL